MDSLDDLVRDLRASAATSRPAPAPAARKRRLVMPRPNKRVWLLSVATSLGLAMALAVVPRHEQPQPESAVVPLPSATVTRPDLLLVRTPSEEQWMAIVRCLDSHRGGAFMYPDRARLSDIDALGSEALTHDQAMLRKLRMSATHASAYPLSVQEVQEQFLTVGRAQPRARLNVTDAMGEYSLIDASGSVVKVIPTRPTQVWQVDLLWVPNLGWRYAATVSAESAR